MFLFRQQFKPCGKKTFNLTIKDMIHRAKFSRSFFINGGPHFLNSRTVIFKNLSDDTNYSLAVGFF